jgi:hypothetical protein
MAQDNRGRACHPRGRIEKIRRAHEKQDYKLGIREHQNPKHLKPDVNGNNSLKLIQAQLDIHDEYLKRTEAKLDVSLPEFAMIKERSATNRWLIGLLIVAFFGLVGSLVLKLI